MYDLCLNNISYFYFSVLYIYPLKYCRALMNHFVYHQSIIINKIHIVNKINIIIIAMIIICYTIKLTKLISKVFNMPFI